VLHHTHIRIQIRKRLEIRIPPGAKQQSLCLDHFHLHSRAARKDRPCFPFFSTGLIIHLGKIAEHKGWSLEWTASCFVASAVMGRVALERLRSRDTGRLIANRFSSDGGYTPLHPVSALRTLFGQICSGVGAGQRDSGETRGDEAELGTTVLETRRLRRLRPRCVRHVSERSAGRQLVERM
jgi:hypothetical protein